MTPADARVIATAEPPRTPTFPKVWQTILLVTLAAFLVSGGVAAAATLASDEAQAAPMPMAFPPPPAMTVQAAASPASRAEGPKLSDPNPLEPSAPAPWPFEPTDAALTETSRSAHALTERLMRLRTPDGRLVALIAGDGSGRALTLALETARLLSAKGPTLLVDLGATQGWLGDILEREETDSVEVPGLADLLDGRAGFGEIIRRDLSSRLDVIPAGGDATGGSLEDVFAALVSAYDCVVFHASDWQSAPARAAADSADAVVLVAPTALLRGVVEEARETLGDGARILPFAVMRPQSILEEVA